VSEARDPRDPRFRPFRIAAYGFYLFVVVAFCLLVIVSVLRSGMAMTPRPPRAVDEVLTVPECIEQAQELWRSLDRERRALTDVRPVREVDQRWTGFRVEWMRQLRELEARCAVDAHARPELRRIFRRLDGLQDLYTTHAVQFAGGVGAAVDRLDAAFRDARDRN
jgi:predicted secreted Zn-dependent protease